MFTFTLYEFLDLIIMSLAIGFIFKDLFPRKPKVEVFTPEEYMSRVGKRFNWDDFWFAVAVVGSSIFLHEMGHKIIASSFGHTAVFHADYTWLMIGVVLKLLSFPFIIVSPAYVLTEGVRSFGEQAWISVAGPLVNLLLWVVPWFIMKARKKIRKDAYHFMFLLSKINMWLFIFNMLPIPGFDGWNFYSSLFRALF